MGGRGTSSPVAKYTVRSGSGTLPPGQGREDEEKEPISAAAERETVSTAFSSRHIGSDSRDARSPTK